MSNQPELSSDPKDTVSNSMKVGDWVRGRLSLADQWVERDEQLRELLSYCKTQDGRYMKPHEAYRDVAGKLAKILDGEQ